jgi:hypothetical protein
MSGYITEGPIGNSLAEAEGTAQIPATFGQAMGATFGQAFAENPASRLARLVARNLDANPITMTAEEANAQYGIEGRLTFTEPTTRSVARDLNDFHYNSARREDVVRRRGETGFLETAAGFGMGLGASLFDPLNVGSALIPFFGPARIATAIGASARGAAGRFGVRFLEGAGQGAVGATLLEPANIWLSMQDRDDYTMGDALMNIAVGTIAGGLLGGGIGAVRDRRGLPAWSAEARERALRHSVGALAEGRPVTAAAAMEFVAAREARQELQDFAQTVNRFTREADEALATAMSRGDALGATETKLADLRDMATRVRAEIDDLRASMDDTTSVRLAEVEKELSGPIPAARRADLERRRTLLMEGSNEDANLGAARTEAQIVGLSRELGRINQRAALVETQAQRAATAARAAEQGLTAKSAALAAREQLVEELTLRTLRKLAGGLGAQIKPDELADMASRITMADNEARLRARPEDADAMRRAVVREISDRAPAGPYQPAQLVEAPGGALLASVDARIAAQEARAGEAMAAGVRGAPDPISQAAEQAAVLREETAIKIEGTPEDELAAATKAVADIERNLRAVDQQNAQRIKEAGGTPPKEDPELAEAAEITKQGDALAKAYQAAAICQISRGA